MSATIQAPARSEQLGDAPAPRPARAHRFSFTVLKTTMAITGTIMALFVVVHMVGNLKAFLGPHAYNSYAAWLRRVAYPLVPHEGLLWALRAVLVVCVILHVTAGTALWLRGRRARGSFRRRGMPARTFGARSMLPTGALIGVFILIHILDLTVGRVIAPRSFSPPSEDGGTLTVSAYENLVASLSRPGMALFYSLVMLAVGVHLAQGLWNVVVDLGGTGPRLRTIGRALALAVGLAVALANGALPLLILSGVIA